MGKKHAVTARALLGLVNDLSDEQLHALTRSECRPQLKIFLEGLLKLKDWGLQRMVILQSDGDVGGALRSLIEQGLLRLNESAEELLSIAVTVPPITETELDLVIVQNSELDLPDLCAIEVVYERALVLGLELCPVQVVTGVVRGIRELLAFERECSVQNARSERFRGFLHRREIDGALKVGMQPLVLSDGTSKIFFVEQFSINHPVCLRAISEKSSREMHGRWVFVKPRSPGDSPVLSRLAGAEREVAGGFTPELA